jgi:hypothetical protein
MTEDLAAVVIEGRTWPVKRTARRRLRQVDFQFDGKDIRGFEQNPDTKSRLAQIARAGKKVMQFLGDARYPCRCGGWPSTFLHKIAATVERLAGESSCWTHSEKLDSVATERN